MEITENVAAFGFQINVRKIQNIKAHALDDITVSSGIISKTSDVILENSPIPCITHSAAITGGHSGGASDPEEEREADYHFQSSPYIWKRKKKGGSLCGR